MVTCPIALKLASNVVRPPFFLVLFKGSTCPVMVNGLFYSFWALKALYTTRSHYDAWQELRCYQLVVGWHWSLLWILGDLDCLAFSISVAFHWRVSFETWQWGVPPGNTGLGILSEDLHSKRNMWRVFVPYAWRAISQQSGITQEQVGKGLSMADLLC